MQKYVTLTMLLFVIVIVSNFFGSTILAQTVPSQSTDTTPVEIKKFSLNVWQRPIAVPLLPQSGLRFNEFKPSTNFSERLMSVGPLRLESRIIGRAPGQDVFYRVWERPRLSIWNMSPSFSIRRDRYTKQYGFKLGIKLRF
jgi:hypothetical protein